MIVTTYEVILSVNGHVLKIFRHGTSAADSARICAIWRNPHLRPTDLGSALDYLPPSSLWTTCLEPPSPKQHGFILETPTHPLLSRPQKRGKIMETMIINSAASSSYGDGGWGHHHHRFRRRFFSPFSSLFFSWSISFTGEGGKRKWRILRTLKQNQTFSGSTEIINFT